MLTALERTRLQSPGEARWPVAFTIFAVVFLLGVLPGRIRMFSPWVPYILGAAVLIPMIGLALSSEKTRWLRLERGFIVIFFLIAGFGALLNLVILVGAIVNRPAEVTGMELLTSSVGVWITNVLAFSLLYWQMDRGGPGARMSVTGPSADWLFTQEHAPEVPGDAQSDWRPTFVDYLFLGFTTATAFSPSDALPMTPRAKVVTMLESAISLVTIAVVASRAISILGN